MLKVFESINNGCTFQLFRFHLFILCFVTNWCLFLCNNNLSLSFGMSLLGVTVLGLKYFHTKMGCFALFFLENV